MIGRAAANVRRRAVVLRLYLVPVFWVAGMNKATSFGDVVVDAGRREVEALELRLEARQRGAQD